MNSLKRNPRAVVRCPNNGGHTRFSTTAHIVQVWKVDEEGTYLDVLQDLEVTHDVDLGNTWTCLACGAEAVRL